MRDQDGNRIGAAEVKSLALQALSTEVLEATVAQIHDTNPVVARNAAWIMTHFAQPLIDSLIVRQNEFIDLAMSTENVSLRRLMLNVIERQGIAEKDLRTDFLDFCLSHMSSPVEPSGVQALCMKLAYRQCSYYPELLREFREMLLLMPDAYTAGVSCLRNKILKQIKC